MRDQYCAEHDFYYNPNHMIDTVCPWYEIVKQTSQLRLLAEAVLEAHSKHYPQAYHVGCEACRVAREVMAA